MRNSFFIILFLIFAVVFSQDEISDTAEILDIIAEITDTADIFNILPEIMFDTIPEKNKKTSWYILLSPRVGVDKIQKDYAAFLKERSDSLFAHIRREHGSRFRQNWFQPATASGISFYLGTGVSTKINANSSVETGVGYSFNQLRSVYNVEHSLDSTQEVLRMRSLLVNNALWLSANYKAGFDSLFFNIKGIDAAGFYVGGAFVLSRYFERDTINTINTEYGKFNERRRENYDGFGGAGRIGIFAQQKIGRHSIFEYSIGYLFFATTGYENFWDRGISWINTENKGKILAISNNFELSFTLIF